ncbi:hypothetical protein M8818_004900 [Zalaria obscura]|uniref:Uncharacterized protein n=1 Tax=Zalaria obscura TaxID=2024903 RepID=A0ACC3SAW1_9PEZI
MSLVRAFTTRRNRPEISAPFMSRAASQRSPGKPVVRSQISSPVALISTTNVLSYDAPNILGTAPIPGARNTSSASSVSSSHSSADDSDGGSSNDMRSSGTLTDASSVDEPITPGSPEPNHLSCYFKPAVTTSNPASAVSSPRPSFDAPAIPRRAPSHSKKAHVQLSRKRSVQRMVNPPSTAQEMARHSTDMFSKEIDAPNTHPFGRELEQLNEVAEEFGSAVRDAEADADRVFMEAHGLEQYGATDYMTEIQDLLSSILEEECSGVQYADWI